ncbi:MAG: alpha/beta fold hydrolase [Streptosporangiaceae bacterium]
MSTPRSLELPYRVRSVTMPTDRGDFAALEAQPGHGVCERRPALLIPGYTGSKEDFLPVLEPLAAADRTVVAMDLRGQYQSPPAAERDGYAAAELAADVLAVAAAVGQADGTFQSFAVQDSAGQDPSGQGPVSVHLVGHSMGGLIARHAALLRTGRVLSLTLLSSGPGAIGGERAVALRQLLAILDPHQGRDPDDRDQLGASIARLWRERLEPQARLDATDEGIIAFLRERTFRTCPIGLIAMARYLLTCPDRTSELAALSRPPGTASAPAPVALPVMVIYGENDDAWPPAAQQRMARALDAEQACIPGAAHSPAVEAPETTAQAMTTFWNAAERRRPASHSPR